MSDIAQIIQSGSAHAWLYIPVAILLGALHGLEPGHSKTMMAAFIIAIRGTFWQAVLLGLSAAISHSLLIWVLAALALHYGGKWNAEHTEPYFHLASAAMIFVLAVWMYLRTRREVAETHAHDYRDGHDHSHSQDGDRFPHFPHDIPRFPIRRSLAVGCAQGGKGGDLRGWSSRGQGPGWRCGSQGGICATWAKWRFLFSKTAGVKPLL